MIAAIATIFVIAFLVQLFYYLYFYLRLILYSAPPAAQSFIEPISVIICARNEAANLHKNLPTILNQNYIYFEVIVVNDASEDDTTAVVEALQKQYNNLKLVHIKKGKGKKNAAEQGIAAAANERLVFTDADCHPASTDWLLELVQHFRQENVILGFSPYLPQNSFLNKLIRFETAHTALQYFSFALAGLPYMGVGRNLAYTREVFRYTKGFENHKELLSGDDDLLVNEASANYKAAISIAPGSFVFSQPKEKWQDWFNQKYRHFSTGTSYKLKHKILLGLLNASHFIFYISFLILIILIANPFWILLLFLIRLFLQWIIFSSAFRKLGESDLVKYLPLFDFIYIIYLVIFTPAVFFNKNAQWQ